MHKLILKLIILLLTLLSLPTYADSAFSNRPDVQKFIAYMIKKYHFNHDQLVSLFNTVHIHKRVMRNIKAPLEMHPWDEYRMVFVNPSHIRKGVEFWNKHEKALTQTEKKYGVPAGIIVATLGVETLYGKGKGEFPVIEALSTIAFSQSTRAHYFKSELENFLLLAREQGLNPRTLRGSYAGAIGYPQFMPSSYRLYAVSYSGQKHIDLSNNPEDAIASIGNYYHKHGWKENQRVAIPTVVEKNNYLSLIKKDPTTIKTPWQLKANGILPYFKIPANEKFNLIKLDSARRNEYWIGLTNFQVIKRYNSSNLYAMAVYQLSSYITILKASLQHVKS